MRIWTAINVSLFVVLLFAAVINAAARNREGLQDTIRALLLVISSAVVETVVVIWKWALS